MRIKRTEFLQVVFDNLSMDELLSEMGEVSSRTPFRYVVTPNVDHVVRLHSGSDEAGMLANAYENADYCVCDSKVLAALAKFHGISLSVTPGSDLTEMLFAKVIEPGDRIALVGGDAQVTIELEKRYPGIEFLLHSPPMGLLRNPAARSKAARFVMDAEARFTFICVGSPQQELIATEIAAMKNGTGVAFCVGAALDFIVSRQTRAPRFLRRLGLEWLHRLSANPRRLWRRYLIEGPKIFVLAARWRRQSK